MAPQTEADPVALLLQFLIYGGNAIGRGPYFQVGKDRHYTNLFGLLVGDTAKARKGLSAGHIRDFYMSAVPEWAGSCIRTGMSSGEGIIHHVRDPVLAMRKGKLQTIDPGVDDKRLLIDEREFQQALTVMQRQGNTLSTVVRDAWDCRQVLETLTKKEPTKATKPFLSIGGHITLDELKESLDRTAMANGYANRFLIAFIHRSKELPLGGNDVDLTGLIERTRAVLDAARGVERVNLTDSAQQLWCEIYPVCRRDSRAFRGHHGAGGGANATAGADLRAARRCGRDRSRSHSGRARHMDVLRSIRAIHLRRSARKQDR